MPTGKYIRTKPVSEETKHKISLSLKGRTSPLKGKPRSEEVKHKISLSHIGLGKGRISPMKGKKLSEETKQKIRLALLGKKASEETRKKLSLTHKGKKFSKEIRENMRIAAIKRMSSNDLRLKISLAHKGNKSRFWKGGITPINKAIRNSLEYRLWRESVFKRDKFTCQWCGDNRGGHLNADHIRPFSLYPELRFAIDNGRTLCIDCHRKTSSYLAHKSFQLELL